MAAIGKKTRRSSRPATAQRRQYVPPPIVDQENVNTAGGEKILMPVRSIVKGRWRIEKQLARGAFGQISVARDLHTNRLVAVKSEAINAPMTFLRMEVTVLRTLQMKMRQVPRFIACGHTPDVNYLIMHLLGPSVMELKKKTADDRFSIGTAIRVADQMTAALRCLHEAGYIHRDVKPSNFVIGSNNEDRRLVYMLDFGLCRQFIDPITGKQRPPRMRCGFRGTVRYACIDTLKSLDVGRDGDMWSLFYVLMEMINGQLPWRRANDKQQVLEWKLGVPPVQLIQGEPMELHELVDHLQSLDYYSCPDYDRIRQVFARILNRFQISDDTPMDWESISLDQKCVDFVDPNPKKQESGKSEAGEGEEPTVVSERGVIHVDG